ncbi:MAG TPA: hypothetical protein VK875_09690 [Euzebyales bacterium]|nr:hypothetical protein [Euzebyales bacterium]
MHPYTVFLKATWEQPPRPPRRRRVTLRRIAALLTPLRRARHRGTGARPLPAPVADGPHRT